ncbi:MAG: transposase [Sphingomonadaceae bacterium]
MGYSTGCHTTFHHRYHLVWAPKYRFKVQRGEVRLRVREIIRQICAEMGDDDHPRCALMRPCPYVR